MQAVDFDTATIARWRARLEECLECRPFQRDELQELLDAAELLARVRVYAYPHSGVTAEEAIEAAERDMKAGKERSHG